MYIDLQKRNCPLCNDANSKFLFSSKDYRYHSVENEFEYSECTKCQHIFLSTYPKKEDVVKLYPPTLMNYGDIETSNSIGYRVKNHLDFINIRNTIKKTGIQKISALDIGCGTGLYLDQLKKLNGHIAIETLEGMEISEHACQVAKGKGYTIHQCLLEDFQTDKKYNVIIMQQVIEHLHDLDASFKILSKLLSPDGILIIETPNMNCLDRAIFKKYWEGYHTPRHFNLFRKKSFGTWLGKYSFAIHEMKLKIKPVHWIYSFQNMLIVNGDKEKGLARFFTYKNTFLLLFFTPFDLFQILFLRKSSDVQYILKKKDS
ncbi:hypothetical protein CAP35_11980 [Chitinophagaceae bacterium IBVUCB1]|nr:hypothetical protein CAP35_11980 [Chitinophagaceae bacterium IBVUCB1]